MADLEWPTEAMTAMPTTLEWPGRGTLTLTYPLWGYELNQSKVLLRVCKSPNLGLYDAWISCTDNASKANGTGSTPEAAMAAAEADLLVRTDRVISAYNLLKLPKSDAETLKDLHTVKDDVLKAISILVAKVQTENLTETLEWPGRGKLTRQANSTPENTLYVGVNGDVTLTLNALHYECAYEGGYIWNASMQVDSTEVVFDTFGSHPTMAEAIACVERDLRDAYESHSSRGEALQLLVDRYES